eukprot:5037462-Pyramimonas_sp.AAC.1
MKTNALLQDSTQKNCRNIAVEREKENSQHTSCLIYATGHNGSRSCPVLVARACVPVGGFRVSHAERRKA